MRMPLNTLDANWAHMVAVSLAWTLKAWYALLCEDAKERDALLAMEFKAFAARAVRVTCQVLIKGGRIVSRVLRWTQWLEEFFAGAGRVRRLRMAQ